MWRRAPSASLVIVCCRIWFCSNARKIRSEGPPLRRQQLPCLVLHRGCEYFPGQKVLNAEWSDTRAHPFACIRSAKCFQAGYLSQIAYDHGGDWGVEKSRKGFTQRTTGQSDSEMALGFAPRRPFQRAAFFCARNPQSGHHMLPLQK